jgi:hypothetical protein
MPQLRGNEGLTTFPILGLNMLVEEFDPTGYDAQ